MSDGAAIGAAAAALAGAMTTVGAAIKGLADIKGAKDALKVLVGDDGNGGVIGVLRHRIEEVAGLIDPSLRADLTALAEKVNRYRGEIRTAARGLPLGQTGSFPSLESISALSQRLDDLARRLKEVEDRATRNENKLEKIEGAFTEARIEMAEIGADIRHLLGRPK